MSFVISFGLSKCVFYFGKDILRLILSLIYVVLKISDLSLEFSDFALEFILIHQGMDDSIQLN